MGPLVVRRVGMPPRQCWSSGVPHSDFWCSYARLVVAGFSSSAGPSRRAVNVGWRTVVAESPTAVLVK